MKLVSSQQNVVSQNIMGMTEERAQQEMLRLFGQISDASKEFLLGIAMDLALEDPAPKKLMPAEVLAPLQLVFA